MLCTLDLLVEMVLQRLVFVSISLTTEGHELKRILDPYAAAPAPLFEEWLAIH